MKKLSVFLLVLFFYSASAFSQINLTTNFSYNKTTGEFTNNYKTGVGVSGGIEFYLQNSDIALSTELGYIKFTTLYNLFGFSPDMDIITFTGGIKYFVRSNDSKIYPYFGAKLGLMSSKVQDFDNSYKLSFIWAPEAGLRFQIAQSGTAIDANIQYNNSSKKGAIISFIGFNVGLAFAL